MVNKRQYSRKTGNRLEPNSIDLEISTISELSISQLHKAWKERFTSDAPLVRSRVILCRLLAWRLQSDSMGGIDSATERALTKIGEALGRDGSYEPKIRGGLSSGVVLSREWKGVIHRVTAAPEGFDYLGKSYRSLSDIARTITGTRWSGPRFFGLELKKTPISRAVTR